MAQNFRHGEILKRAREQGRVLVEDLAEHFQVTVQTIRRDLTELCDQGHLTRVYGGAVLPSGVANIRYEERRDLNPAAKEAIAREVAAMIPDDASVFLGIGTTTEAVARALGDHRNLMAVTNNLNVANILASNPTSEVVVAGGVLRRADAGLVGDMTLELLRNFKVDIAVIGTSALDLDGDLLDFDFREARVNQMILASARATFLAADSSKFARKAPVRIASLADVDRFFTDRGLPDPLGELCLGWKTEVHLPKTPFERDDG